MKKITQLFLLLITVACFQQSLLAQSKKIDDVLLVEMRDMGAIKNGDEVTGYYLFYKTDKARKGFSSFELQILDTELNEVMVKKMNEPSSTSLSGASSNGESILFKFWQTEGKVSKMKFKGYNYQGESVITKGVTIRERAELGMYQSMGGYLNVFGTAAIPNYGYVEYMPKKFDKTIGYQMRYIPSNKETIAWTKKGSSSKWESAQYLCTIDSTLISLVNTRAKKMSTAGMSYLVKGINIASGKELFSVNLQDQGLNAMVINGTASLDGENIVLYGLYYPEGEKVTKKSSGLVKIIMDKKGKVIEDFKLSWENDFDLEIEEGEDLGNIHFHEFLYGEDGKTYLIAEQFGLNTGGTVLLNALSRGAGAAFKVKDLLVIELNKDFKVEKMEVIEKSQNSHVTPGIPIASSQTIGYLLDYFGHFDFSYLQQKEKPGEFTIGYVNFEKIKGEKNKLIFGGVTRTEGEYAYDKMPISIKGSEVRVMEGKPGYICLMEYTKKEKSIDLRLEKINF